MGMSDQQTEEEGIVNAPESERPYDESAIEHRRMIEALLFASSEPLSVGQIASRLPEDADIEAHITDLVEDFANRGVQLVEVGGKWQFRTAPDLSFLLRREMEEQRKLSRAGVETLAIIAYHQPVTRAEIEEIRGVSISKGTMDVLIEAGWMRPMGRRRTPGRPMTYGTTEEFLVHFGLSDIKDLPGIEELKAAGLLDSVDIALDKMGDDILDVARDDSQMDLEEAIAAKLKEKTEELVGGDIFDPATDQEVGDDDPLY